MGFQQKSKIKQIRVKIFPSSDSRRIQSWLSYTSNIKTIQKPFVYLLPAMVDVRGSKAIAITIVSLKIWLNPC